MEVHFSMSGLSRWVMGEKARTRMHVFYAAIGTPKLTDEVQSVDQSSSDCPITPVGSDFYKNGGVNNRFFSCQNLCFAMSVSFMLAQKFGAE